MSNNQFELERFVLAQSGDYRIAIAELRSGHKQSHWIWYIFPQLRALGRSTTAQHYGLETLAEAAAYWEHPVLGPRLRECIQTILQVKDKSATAILGEIDALKFRSCLTLFREAAPTNQDIRSALARFYAGEPDPITLHLLRGQQDGA
jgi:uncharacterized protein (DUF1810 family)